MAKRKTTKKTTTKKSKTRTTPKTKLKTRTPKTKLATKTPKTKLATRETKTPSVKKKKTSLIPIIVILILVVLVLSAISLSLFYKNHQQKVKAENELKQIDNFKIEIGRKYHFSNIYFEPQTATIQKQSYYMVNHIYEILKINDTLMVDIIGHTDKPNQELSQQRAQAILNYIANKGISRSRMTAIGKSDSEPLVTNQYDLSKNRRVEFIFHY